MYSSSKWLQNLCVKYCSGKEGRAESAQVTVSVIMKFYLSAACYSLLILLCFGSVCFEISVFKIFPNQTVHSNDNINCLDIIREAKTTVLLNIMSIILFYSFYSTVFVALI